MAHDSAILDLGCGNSRMCEEMLNEDYKNLTLLDNCEIVIADMEERYKENQNLKIVCQDARNTGFEADKFDVVIDKGTLDCILAGEMSTANAYKMLAEVHKILAPNGVYICVSHGKPEHRIRHLENPEEFGWEIRQYKIAKQTQPINVTEKAKNTADLHYIYVCVKR